ncbi:MAG TPA: protein kinase [Rudaea sp.]|uniref:protein kinase domain-containing protein n=1 Tax=Rudaea sp. TaxID=2136325 RepID=UPI002F91EEC9
MFDLPGFHITRELGRGGMATVYVAEQTSLGREVALKVLDPQLATDPTFTERLLREARTVASLHHPHIVAVHDVGVHQGTQYITMEYLPLGSIATSGVQLSPREALRCVREIASALDYAHAHGIVHRDVKPANILRHEHGNYLLADFGIARQNNTGSTITGAGSVIGTPAYMSPEQWRGGELDGRADLYSLGIVLYELLTGVVPYAGSDQWAVGMQHVNAAIPELPAQYRGLQGLLARMLAKQPADRVATGAEVVTQIEAIESDQRAALATPRSLPGVPMSQPSQQAATRISGPLPELGVGADRHNTGHDTQNTPSFFAELKRRNVLRAGAFYAVGAWLLVQVATQILPFFHIADGVVRWLIVAAAVGFPFALGFAWFYEITPDGLKRESEVEPHESIMHHTGKKLDRWIVGIMAAAIVLLLTDRLLLHREANVEVTPNKAQTSTDAAPPAVAERSIAVLPFVNMSGDPKNEYFSDGLAETTLDMLAQVPDLKVIARTSSFAFKGKAQDMRQIGAALGAANLLEGSVQGAGDIVRITVQLIRAADGSHLWSHHYDRPMADVFKVQDEIASQVVQELAIALPASQQQRLTQKRTENVEAYQEYLKGIALMPQRKVADLHEAAQHFERAIVLDPGYVRAYAAASDTYNLLDNYGTITAAERERMAAYVDRALTLAPDLGEAHISRASLLDAQGDWSGAEQEFRRGTELAPSYASGFHWYGEFLNNRYGRAQEALAMGQRAAALDPLSPIVQGSLIGLTMATGRFKEAETLLAKLHADHPDFAAGYGIEAYLAMTQGDLVRALRAMRESAARDPGALGTAGNLCGVMLRFDAMDDAHRCVDTMAKSAPDSVLVQIIAAGFKAWSGDWAGAQVLVDKMAQPDASFKALVLTALGRSSDVLTIYRRSAPQLFNDPPAKLYLGQASDALNVGLAMLRTGAQAQGRALLQQALLARVNRPQITDYTEWDDVRIHVALGESEQAIAALKQAVADGYFLDIQGLDSDPLLAELRNDPRYAQILAPARAKAAAQVAAAHAADLL